MSNTFKRNNDSTLDPYYWGGADITLYSFVDILIENNTMIEVLSIYIFTTIVDILIITIRVDMYQCILLEYSLHQLM